MSDVSTPTSAELKRFCRLWLIAMMVLVPLVAVFDIAMDPFLVFGSPRIAGVNDVKPTTLERAELVKHHLLQRVRPDTLMLGTSKVQLGMDPRSPLWPQDSGVVFNGGVPGQPLVQTVDEFNDVVARAPVRRVMLMVEVVDLMWPGSDATPQGHFLPTEDEDLHDRFMATLSLDALRSSVVSLISQRDPYGISMANNGMMNDSLFREASDKEGAAALFEQKFPTVAGAVTSIRRQLEKRPQAPINGITALRKLIRVAREKGIALDIGIAPMHCVYLEVIDANGLWPRYLAAKAAITQAVAEEGQGRVALWDFVGFDAFSTEPVPAHGDLTHKTRWFWEPNHFKVVIGEKILEAMYHGGNEYGVRLTPANLKERLEADTQAKEQFYKSSPARHEAVLHALGVTP